MRISTSISFHNGFVPECKGCLIALRIISEYMYDSREAIKLRTINDVVLWKVCYHSILRAKTFTIFMSKLQQVVSQFKMGNELML